MKKTFALLLCAAMSVSGITALAQEDAAATVETRQVQRAEMRAAYREADEVSLFEELEVNESTVTLSGTVSLPSGSKALEECYIRVYAIPVGETFINAGNMDGISKWFYMQQGESSVSYSLDVPKGNYILKVYAEGAAENTILGTNFYYRNGKMVNSYSLAEKISITANKTVNLELEKADRSISGTITLTESLAEDTWAYLYASTHMYNNEYYVDSEIEMYLEKGTTKIDYNLPTAAGNTEVFLYGINDSDLMFSSTDELTDDWNYCRIFDTSSKSYTNVNYTYDNSESGGIPDTTGKIPVTVTLPQAAEEHTWYYVCFYDAEDGDRRAGSSVDFDPGDTTATVYLRNPGLDFQVSISDDSEYYCGGEHGLTTNMENADTFSWVTTTDINIDMPDCYELTGTVDRTGFFDGNGVSLDVSVEIGDEIFWGYAECYGLSDTAEFSVDIPKWFEGDSAEASVSFGDSEVYDTATVTVGQSMTASMSIPSGSTTTVNGTITLLKAAPTGGVGIVLGDWEKNVFYIPEGETSIDYSAEFINSSENGTKEVRVSSDAEDINYITSNYKQLDLNADMNDIEIAVYDYVKLSGSIKISESIPLDSGMMFDLNLWSDMLNKWTSCYVDKTTRTGNYTFYVPRGAEVYDLYCYPYIETEAIPYEIRYIHNGDEQWESFTINSDITNADIVIMDNAAKMLDAIKNGDLEIKCESAVFGYECVELEVSYKNLTTSYYEPVVVLAAYDDNGVLKDMVIYDYYIYEEDEDYDYVYIDADIDSSLNYRVFFWNSMGGAAPLTDAVTVTEQ